MKKIPLLFAVLISMSLCFTCNAAAAAKLQTIIAISKDDGLYMLRLGEPEKKITAGETASPKISKDGKYIAFTKGPKLLVADADTLKASTIVSGEKLKDFGVGYIWGSDGTLYYAPSSGGLYLYKDGKSKQLADKKYRYTSDMLSIGDCLYAEKSRSYMKDSQEYIENIGIVRINVKTAKQKIVVADRPADWDNGFAGMIPMIAGASADNRYLYVFMHYHAGSLSADGIPFGVYDTKTGKFKEYEKVGNTLVGRSFVSGNPTNAGIVAIETVASRFMWDGRSIVSLNLKDGKVSAISPQKMIAVTPSWSPDGKLLYYSASPEVAEDKRGGNAGRLEMESPNRQFIYSYDTITGKRQKLTDAKNAFDISPIGIDGGAIFTRVYEASSESPRIAIWQISGSTCKEIIKPFVNKNYYTWFSNLQMDVMTIK